MCDHLQELEPVPAPTRHLKFRLYRFFACVLTALLWVGGAHTAAADDGLELSSPVPKDGAVATLLGSFKTDDHTLAPVKALRILIAPTDPNLQVPKNVAPEEGSDIVSIDCQVTDRQWQCILPAGLWDLRIEADSHIPWRYWAVSIEPDQRLEIGALKLQAGSALAGWLRIDDQCQGESIELALEPAVSAAPLDPKAQSRRRMLSRKGVPDHRGYFQFGGLEEGAYILVARCGDLSSPRQEVQVKAGETYLNDPLELLPPAELVVDLDPKLDPWGEPWQLRLSKPLGNRTTFEEVAHSPTSPEGAWALTGLEPGTYELQILDSRTGHWLDRTFDLFSGEESLFIPIDVIPVRGRITQGGEGLATEILFGNGSNTIRMKSAEDGSFEGSLPEEGVWPLAIKAANDAGHQAMEPLVIERRAGKRWAELEIHLPDTVLRGSVMAEGEAVPKAIVLGVRGGLDSRSTASGKRRREIAVLTDAEGAFELLGLSPGEFEIQAYQRDRASEWVQVNLREGSEPVELVLELRRRRKIRGRLLGPSVQTVSGARIIGLPDVGLTTGAETRIDGSFEMKLQADARSIDLIVIPPSAGIFFRRVALGEATESEPHLNVTQEAGDLVVADPRSATFLLFDGVAVPFDRLWGWLAPSNRLRPHPVQGLVVQGLTPGVWTVCSGHSFDPTQCHNIELFAGQESLLLSTPTQED